MTNMDAYWMPFNINKPIMSLRGTKQSQDLAIASFLAMTPNVYVQILTNLYRLVKRGRRYL
jgi:hypothetical protein